MDHLHTYLNTPKLAQDTHSDLRELSEQIEEREALRRANLRYCERQVERESRMEGSLHLIDGHNCPLCRNKGYTVEVEEYRGNHSVIQRSCSCMALRNMLRTLRDNGLDGVMEEYTLERFIADEPWQKVVFRLAEDYLTAFGTAEERERPWFFFGGRSGCGKTHVCTALSVELTKAGTPMRYMLWRDEATRLKLGMTEGGYIEGVNRLKTVPLLYIDDLFKTGRGESQRRQRPSAADLNLAFEVLNARYISRRPTIISSESTLTEIADFDSAIGGRIRERCGRFVINIGEDGGRNYRMR